MIMVGAIPLTDKGKIQPLRAKRLAVGLENNITARSFFPWSPTVAKWKERPSEHSGQLPKA
jgi:hypothetical protein